MPSSKDAWRIDWEEKEMKCCEREDFQLIKKYEPKPKNPDGSIYSFLYRWDDGKDGYRKLVKCKNCGTYFLVQCYTLNKFADNSDKIYEDWYLVENEQEADYINRTYTGIELEHRMEPILQIKKDI